MCTALASVAEEHLGHMTASLPARDKKPGINSSENLPSHQQNCLITNMVLWNTDWGWGEASYCNFECFVGKEANYSSFWEKAEKSYIVLCYLTCDILPM